MAALTPCHSRGLRRTKFFKKSFCFANLWIRLWQNIVKRGVCHALELTPIWSVSRRSVPGELRRCRKKHKGRERGEKLSLNQKNVEELLRAASTCRRLIVSSQDAPFLQSTICVDVGNEKEMRKMRPKKKKRAVLSYYYVTFEKKRTENSVIRLLDG